jgi:hypothetical protein
MKLSSKLTAVGLLWPCSSQEQGRRKICHADKLLTMPAVDDQAQRSHWYLPSNVQGRSLAAVILAFDGSRAGAVELPGRRRG